MKFKKTLVSFLLLFSVISLCVIFNLSQSVENESLDVFYFGEYEIDGNLDNGKEKIPWRVIPIDEKSVIIISNIVIDCMPYDDNPENADWNSCSLNSWLNTTFYAQAFNEDEKKMILSFKIKDKTVCADFASASDKRIFILNSEEITRFFPIFSDRVVLASIYSCQNGVLANSDNAVWWWVRCDDVGTHSVPIVDYQGDIITMSSSRANKADIEFYGIRPAFFLRKA